MKLTWHNYKYYPYERQLAVREAASLFGVESISENEHGIEVTSANESFADRLVYFSQVHDGRLAIDTVQARLERAATAGRNRQATRYSAHGLHEYKGKFNPQVAKAILNIFGVVRGDIVIDPYCGSGTTLVECAQIGVRAAGYDINPLAVFIAKAKLASLSTPSDTLKGALARISRRINRRRQLRHEVPYDERGIFLRSWFDLDILGQVEALGLIVQDEAGNQAPTFLAIISNLLRDYSLQDPNDLRIRRRRSPLPDKPLQDLFVEVATAYIDRIHEAQLVLGVTDTASNAALCDVTQLDGAQTLHRYDAALTSPPYAMALPYIDTQRLSLVWLGLTPPAEILSLEATLTGSREMRGASRKELRLKLERNSDDLPGPEIELCHRLDRMLTPSDGFRRRAVPVLLYRYFCDMGRSFRAVRSVMKPGAPYALIVGHNHTVLGGHRMEIDTPRHLASLAAQAGWVVEEVMALQTYQRYGYHSDNAVSSESLILLRNK